MPKINEERFEAIFFYTAVLLLGYLVCRVFEPFLVPLAWAAVLAIIFYPANKRLQRRWGQNVSALLSTLGVTLILIIPMFFLAILVIREGIGAVHSVQLSMETGDYGPIGRAWDWVAGQLSAWTDVDLSTWVREGASRFGEYFAAKLGEILRHIVLFIFELFVTLFAMFYFLRDGQAILDHTRRLLPFRQDVRDRMLTEAQELIFASVTTSLLIAALQGLVCGAMFAILGIGSAVFWGVAATFLALIPVVNSWPIWLPAAIWFFSVGHSGRAVVLIVICGGSSLLVDDVLRPLLVGQRSSLNALLVFIGVLGGIAAFGVLGIVLGPIVIATAIGILEVYSDEKAASDAAEPSAAQPGAAEPVE